MPPKHPPKLFDQVRNLLRTRHYSYQTEKKYILWMRHFIYFHNKRHPKTLAPSAISEFLTHLAVNRQVSPSTQNQALNALVFLYREVLNIDVGQLPGIEWARPRERVPIVFSRDEVAIILSELEGNQKLIAALLYGCGLRLAEALRLRRKDIDFERNQIAIWDSKGMRDRIVMFPKPLRGPLEEHLKRVKKLFENDRAVGTPGVFLPDALSRKYPNAGESYKWFW